MNSESTLQLPAPIASTLRSAQVIANDLAYVTEQCREAFRKLSGSRLLIAGGAGFLGYYLVQSPLYWNATHPHLPPIRVTVLDSFIRGVPPWLTDLASCPSLRLITHDMSRPLPDDFGHYDYLIHAASIASPTYYRKRPIETMDGNVNGLRYLLDYCLEERRLNRPVSGVLFFSSSEIYGDPAPDNIPTPETYRGNVSCTGPRACYDESKRYGETLCVNFAQQHQVPVKVARPFNNYGPGLKITDRRVISDFAADIFANRDITLLSDGAARRTFCYVADAVCGYFKILVHGQPGEAYNIGVDAPEIAIAELARMIARIGAKRFGYTGKVVHRTSPDKDYLVDNPARRCPDIRKARTRLAYKPQVSLEDGLDRTLAWYSDNRTAPDA